MRIVLALALVAVLAAAGFVTRSQWLPLLSAEPEEAAAAPHDHGPSESVKLDAQAQANLKLVVKPVQTQSYWRTLPMPAEVVERRGRGDQSFTAPASGVVQSIALLPGDTVQPGGALLTLRLTSEAMQQSQLELYKAVLESVISQEQKKRLEAVRDTVPQWQIVDVQNQLSRLAATRRAYRADLALKGLLPEQIDRVEAGNFIRELTVYAPVDKDAKVQPLLELQELKVVPGDQVQSGQLLGLLSNHQNLYIEGHGFREDTPLLEKAAALGAAGQPLTAVFPEEAEGNWPALEKPLTILYLSNTVDPTSQTLPFYVQLPNQHREYSREGKTYRIWRFRPGQRVQLGVPVEEFKDVFVLPVAAVTRDGPNAYVFRQNGDLFKRLPVHIAFEDARHALIANDGSIPPGASIAQNAASAINRALKAQSETGGGGGHCGHEH
jgi:cobalt-zinc-cadmium efflux system membrane fusion protein